MDSTFVITWCDLLLSLIWSFLWTWTSLCCIGLIYPYFFRWHFYHGVAYWDLACINVLCYFLLGEWMMWLLSKTWLIFLFWPILDMLYALASSIWVWLGTSISRLALSLGVIRLGVTWDVCSQAYANSPCLILSHLDKIWGEFWSSYLFDEIWFFHFLLVIYGTPCLVELALFFWWSLLGPNLHRLVMFQTFIWSLWWS